MWCISNRETYGKLSNYKISYRNIENSWSKNKQSRMADQSGNSYLKKNFEFGKITTIKPTIVTKNKRLLFILIDLYLIFNISLTYISYFVHFYVVYIVVTICQKQ